VTALCPGFVRPEFQQRMGLRGQVAPSWAWLEADRLVADCLDDVDRGRVVSIPGRRYRVATAVLRHLPLRMSTRIGRRRATQRR
jgi:short-subunit dehydrogenase